MKLLQRVKTLLTGVAVVLVLASTTFAEPALAKHAGFHHDSKHHSHLFFNWGHGKGVHHHKKNRHFFGGKGFVQRKYKSSRNFGHRGKGLFKKHHKFGFSRGKSFRGSRSFRRH